MHSHELIVLADGLGDLRLGDPHCVDHEAGGHGGQLALQGSFQVLINLV